MRRLLKIQNKTLTQANYYEILGVQRNAQFGDIQQAFKQKLQRYNFNLDSQTKNDDQKQKIQELFQAFGVLSLENERIKYEPKLDLPQTKNLAVSELTDQKYVQMIESKKRLQRKELNFNEYDRYNGGYPNLLSLSRGKSLRPPGSFRDVQTEPICFDSQSFVDLKVSKADAEEFSVYQKFDQYAYEQPKSWLKLEINNEVTNWRNYKALMILMSILCFALISPIFINIEKRRDKYINKMKKQKIQEKEKAQKKTQQNKQFQMFQSNCIQAFL